MLVNRCSLAGTTTVFYLASCLILYASVVSPYCARVTSTHAYCDEANLTGIPANVSSTINYLSLKLNLLSRVDKMFSNFTSLTTLILDSNRIKSIEAGALPSSINLLDLDRNALKRLERGMIPANVKNLMISNNNISEIENGSLPTSLRTLDLCSNRLSSLPYGVFPVGITELKLCNNSIAAVKAGDLPPTLTYLDLSLNQIKEINEGVFPDGIRSLHISENHLTEINANTIPFQCYILSLDGNLISKISGAFSQTLSYVYLRSNNMSEIKKNVWSGTSIRTLELGDNQIVNIEAGALPSSLQVLALPQNRICNIRDGTFDVRLRTLKISRNCLTEINLEKAASYLANVILSHNKIERLVGLNNGICRMEYLWLPHNRLTSIWNWIPQCTYLKLINLSDNWFTEVNQTTLVCPPNLEILILSNNNITLLSPESFLHANNLRQLEIAQINVKELDMSIFLQAPPEMEIVLSQMGSSNLIFTVSGMAASQLATEGYICRRGLGLSSCQGCPVGKYMLDNVCKSCPRGGFYQDEIAELRMNTYGNGCKLCPEGKFSKNPGATSRQDCQGCPLGTKSDFAAFRACSCRDKYYRFDRFGGCFPCPTYYICSNETFTLAPGYYWEWESHKHLEQFESFRWNLNDRSASSDAMTSAFNSAVLPVAYQCPIRESCLGGLHGACSMGYSGPLCAVCSSGYYKHANKCVKCKSLLQWSVGLSLCLCIWVILVIMVWLSIPPPSNKRSVCDIIMANTKIILGFYQLSAESRPLMQGTDLEGPFYTFLSYSNIVQLGFSGTFPLHCLNTDFKFNAATKFAIAVMSNVLVILAGTLMYKVWGWVLTKRKNKKSPQRPQASRGKQRIVGITCLLLFVMYPSTCYHIFSVLPLTCQEICTSRSNCESFLVADFTVSCNKPGFTILTVFACVSFLYVLGFPLAVLILLRHKFKAKKRNKVPEIGLGMRFLYEDYKSQYFYWEFLELIRKLVVTAVLVFLGMQSKLTAGIVGIVSGSYAVLYSHVKPAAEPFQHWLQVLSLLVTMVTTQIIVLARIPVVEESLPVDAKADEQGIQGMIFLAKYAGLIVIPAFFVTLTIQLVRRSRHMSWEAPASYD